MGWIKLDDAFLDHPKYLQAGPLAGYLCIAGIAWCNRHRTDGIIPRAQVRRLVDFDGFAHHVWSGEMVGGGEDADAITLAEELVSVGLWEREGRGYRVHDYHDWQRSSDEIEAALEQRREAGRRGGRARAASGSSNGSPSDSLSAPSSDAPSGAPSENSSEIQAGAQAEVRGKKEEETAFSPGGMTPIARGRDAANEAELHIVEDAA